MRAGLFAARNPSELPGRDYELGRTSTMPSLTRASNAWTGRVAGPRRTARRRARRRCRAPGRSPWGRSPAVQHAAIQRRTLMRASRPATAKIDVVGATDDA